jgi:hypothetical protein
MAKYNSYDEAVRARQKVYDDMTDKFCPVILGSCRRDCATFDKGKEPYSPKQFVKKGKTPPKPYWVFISPSCNHPMITGALYCHVEN